MKKISAFPSLLLLMICASGFMTCISDAQLPGTLSNGLVAYYTFNGNANDSSGNNNNGVASGISYAIDRFGNANGAALFTTGSSVAVPSLDRLPYYPTTYSLWLNMQQSPENGDVLSIIGRIRAWDQESGMLYLIHSQAGGGTLGIDNEIVYYTGATVANSLYQVSTNNWFNLTFTYDADQFASFYINGSLVSSVSSPATQSYSFPFLIGATTTFDGIDDSTHSWIGGMSDVGIWNKALTATEVTDLYNAQVVPEPSTYALLLLSGAASLWALRRRKH
jgi:hypothetical protein